MNSDIEIKKANRKALPKFILIIIISAIVGGGIGFFSAEYGLDALSGGIKTAGEAFGLRVAPWLMLATAIAVLLISLPLYQGAKKLLAAWDGEDEEISDAADQKLSIVIWTTGTALIISYFLIAASYSGGFAMLEQETSVVPLAASIAAFIGIMIEAVIFQQKCVDAVKKINPEKTASVYDMKFQKKWMDSCDEAEKLMIAKCAFKAYGATNTACSILAIALAVCALIFGIGFLPSLVVCVIWIVNQSVYYRETMKYSKAGTKIS